MIRSMDYRTQLITLAEGYGRKTGLSEARIATLVQNQGVFFKRIRAGKGCSVDTYLKVKRWFAAHWPPDLDWPRGVDRPGVLPCDDDEAAAPAPTVRRARKPTHSHHGAAA